MTNEEFKKICMSQFDHCYEIMTSRARQYGRSDDRLAQFKHVAKVRDVTPEEALMGMRAKHESSIEFMIWDLAKGNIAPMSQWQEKITDSINYLLLLSALISERYGAHKELIKIREERPAIIEQLRESELNAKDLQKGKEAIERLTKKTENKSRDVACALPKPLNSNITCVNPVEPPASWLVGEGTTDDGE